MTPLELVGELNSLRDLLTNPNGLHGADAEARARHLLCGMDSLMRKIELDAIREARLAGKQNAEACVTAATTIAEKFAQVKVRR